MMEKLCEKCNICSFMPEQINKRVMSLRALPLSKPTSEPVVAPLVLVIDDAQTLDDQGEGSMWLRDNLLLGTPFDYTSTIRCEYDATEIDGQQLLQAVDHCAVWTHQLLENRAVVI